MNLLLEKVLESHGSLDTWQKFSTISATVRFGGLAFRSKFNNKGLRTRKVSISTKAPTSIFYDYPSTGYTGVFTKDEVRIEAASGQIIKIRKNPRDAFKSFRHNFYWDDLDLLYFAGYAGWNYFNSPFLLSYPGVEVRDLGSWSEKGQTWQKLGVKFPSSIPTHSENQVFYFDKDYRMVRFDYCPEVFAKWARGAHYCSNYTNWNGIWVPSKRKVVPNGNSNISKPFPTLVWIDVKDVKLE